MAPKTPKSKACTKCGRTKKLSEFYHSKRRKSGADAWCAQCTREAAAERRRNNPRAVNAASEKWRKNHTKKFKLSQRRRNLKTRYNLTPDEYDSILSAQEGGCWICGYMPKPGGRRLAVDHDHKIKNKGLASIRGILCHMCNRGLPFFRDNPERLRRAADYLSK